MLSTYLVLLILERCGIGYEFSIYKQLNFGTVT